MILHALYRYYQRKTQEENTDLPPIGFEYVQISYLLVINVQGELVEIISRIEGKGKDKRIKLELVPQSVKRSSGISANLLWDNTSYVLGFDTKGKPERTQGCFQDFIKRIKDAFPNTEDEGIHAVVQFFEKEEFRKVFEHPLWKEISESTGSLSFQLESERRLICQRPVVQAFIENKEQQVSDSQKLCLITGEQSNISELHASIKGIWGGQSSGGNIVSFNAPAFTSFHKENGFNSPVGRPAEYAYTTALNYLLRKGSPQRMQVGDASTIWWASEKTELESSFADLFVESPKDDPDRNASAIEAFLKAQHSGKMAHDADNTNFYVLGLAPNASRIAIRFWYHDTVANLSDHLRRYFDELEIVHAPRYPNHVPLFKLLRATALLNSDKHIHPKLSGDVMSAILSNTPYPYTLLNAVVQRIRSEPPPKSDPNDKYEYGLKMYYRAALLKAWLNRDKHHNNRKEEEITVALDLENKNVAYRLGRLFATLEKTQIDALGDINAGIRDRYYGAASSTPVVVFPRLLKLANHHLSKIAYKGQAVNAEKLIGEILFEIQEFPATLALPDQARFALGYYHQRQVFFTPKADKAEKAA
ncbi:MAG: type I-C CRISPR-associated protein Cas8c/Csd1 [Thiotrichaceae bacterium]|nr:type I-C CRISPR-associated protein Cas8c/Csd1 [Thiotrichaceae bacterium]